MMNVDDSGSGGRPRKLRFPGHPLFHRLVQEHSHARRQRRRGIKLFAMQCNVDYRTSPLMLSRRGQAPVFLLPADNVVLGAVQEGHAIRDKQLGSPYAACIPMHVAALSRYIVASSSFLSLLLLLAPQLCQTRSAAIRGPNGLARSRDVGVLSTVFR